MGMLSKKCVLFVVSIIVFVFELKTLLKELLPKTTFYNVAFVCLSDIVVFELKVLLKLLKA